MGYKSSINLNYRRHWSPANVNSIFPSSLTERAGCAFTHYSSIAPRAIKMIDRRENRLAGQSNGSKQISSHTLISIVEGEAILASPCVSA